MQQTLYKSFIVPIRKPENKKTPKNQKCLDGATGTSKSVTSSSKLRLKDLEFIGSAVVPEEISASPAASDLHFHQINKLILCLF